VHVIDFPGQHGSLSNEAAYAMNEGIFLYEVGAADLLGGLDYFTKNHEFVTGFDLRACCVAAAFHLRP
jgi:hypothetical protein